MDIFSLSPLLLALFALNFLLALILLIQILHSHHLGLAISQASDQVTSLESELQSRHNSSP